MPATCSNPPSAAVLRKCGFALEATMRRAAFKAVRGVMDLWMFGLLRPQHCHEEEELELALASSSAPGSSGSRATVPTQVGGAGIVTVEQASPAEGAGTAAKQPPIAPERVGFRPFRDGDAPRLAALADDASIAACASDRFPHPYT
jgi:hypothetical protein